MIGRPPASLTSSYVLFKQASISSFLRVSLLPNDINIEGIKISFWICQVLHSCYNKNSCWLLKSEFAILIIALTPRNPCQYIDENIFGYKVCKESSLSKLTRMLIWFNVVSVGPMKIKISKAQTIKTSSCNSKLTRALNISLIVFSKIGIATSLYLMIV